MSTTSDRTDRDADDTGPDIAIRPEDEKVGAGTAAFYGLQHILAMYAGVVSPPITSLRRPG
jgi:xanthine/uracil permease